MHAGGGHGGAYGLAAKPACCTHLGCNAHAARGLAVPPSVLLLLLLVLLMEVVLPLMRLLLLIRLLLLRVGGRRAGAERGSPLGVDGGAQALGWLAPRIHLNPGRVRA